MPRNLDHRVEVLLPVKAPTLVRHLREEVLETYLHDNVRAREMRADGSYVRSAPREGEAALDSHAAQVATRAFRHGGA